MENIVEVKADHIVNIIMVDNPEYLRDELGLLTVYKNPNVEVQAIIPAVTNQGAVAEIFGSMVTEGYMVTLKIPDDDYASVMQSLENEPLITKINGSNTTSGNKIEEKVREMASDNDDDNTSRCTIS